MTAAKPTPRQLAYLNALIERAGLTPEQWRESFLMIVPSLPCSHLALTLL
jgi:hypothetical protein